MNRIVLFVLAVRTREVAHRQTDELVRELTEQLQQLSAEVSQLWSPSGAEIDDSGEGPVLGHAGAVVNMAISYEIVPRVLS